MGPPGQVLEGAGWNGGGLPGFPHPTIVPLDASTRDGAPAERRLRSGGGGGGRDAPRAASCPHGRRGHARRRVRAVAAAPLEVAPAAGTGLAAAAVGSDEHVRHTPEGRAARAGRRPLAASRSAGRDRTRRATNLG